ncbi:hypothetical protein [Streptomyces sp. MZ04]|uniref:hypothetical protein n=1 Tax=Streptomyces sp. MZ04 TaxID=2559236 RepID=UPI00107EC344|nr:hypothetical protein [Streptomyces sp. MZ04]TGA97447.1 hypothetical protein E2651_31385 [Streptomyces sp. MZ04]
MTTTDLIDGAIGVMQDFPGHVERLGRWVVSNAWWVALLVLGAGVAVGVIRWLLARGPMAERTALEVLPTTGFDPKVEEVVRFGHQIARAHKSVSRWLFSPTCGSAVRVRFTCSGGALSMRVEGPAKAMSVLRHQGYAQVEMRPVEAGGLAAHDRPQIRLGTQSAS